MARSARFAGKCRVDDPTYGIEVDAEIGAGDVTLLIDSLLPIP